MGNQTKDDTNAMIAALAENQKPQILSTTGHKIGDILITPAGMMVREVAEYLEPFLPRPLRKKGTIISHDLDSFIAAMQAHTQTEKDTGTAGGNSASKSTVFVKKDGTSIVGILNFHGPGADQQDHSDLRVSYAPKFSKQWKDWQEVMKNGAIPTNAFADFIDEHIEDIDQPPEPVGKGKIEGPDARFHKLASTHKTTYAAPEELLLLARGMKVGVNAKVEEKFDPQTGEITALLQTEHKADTGAASKPNKVPGLFLLLIPVFEGGALYRLPVRLRYRVANGLLWSFNIINEQKALDDAVGDMKKRIAEETKLSTWYGDFLK
jgi:hypothetical protein